MCKILPRIKQVALNEGITIGAMERIIGASKGVLSRAIANGTDIQSKWLEAIVENYPQYSARWILTGVGDMMAETDNSPQKSEKLEEASSQPEPEGIWKYLQQKDIEIGRLHEENGRLKARIEQLERELEEVREFPPVELDSSVAESVSQTALQST